MLNKEENKAIRMLKYYVENDDKANALSTINYILNYQEKEENVKK